MALADIRFRAKASMSPSLTIFCNIFLLNRFRGDLEVFAETLKWTSHLYLSARENPASEEHDDFD